MDQIFTIIGALLAVLLGWVLNGITHTNRASKEHKRAIAHALSILLEVRHQMVYLDQFMRSLKEKGLPEEVVPAIRALVDNIGLGKEGLDKEYENALEIVAQNAPLVAFEFRSRASAPQTLKKLRAMALEDGTNPHIIEAIDTNLTKLILPHMNELVQALAKLHSRKSAKEVRLILENEFEMPEGINDYFASILEADKALRLKVQKQQEAKEKLATNTQEDQGASNKKAS